MKKKKSSEADLENSFDRIEAREATYLYISKSQIPNSGNGLYTAITIWKNEIISLFKGEIISSIEAKKREKKGQYKYFINRIDGTIMDSLNTKCFAKYANDSKGLVKSEFKLNSIITLDDEDNVCLVATRNIKVGEEIFCSYGKNYWKMYKKEIRLGLKKA
ncbi:MAG: SET domain-containing protein-lysine N-methyltransferase [Saprospiraceae bacterium]